MAAALRSWRRHFARAREIDAVRPDGTLLLKALEPACTLIASLDAQASFRLAQSRLKLGVDQQPHSRSMALQSVFAHGGRNACIDELNAYRIHSDHQGQADGGPDEVFNWGEWHRQQRQGHFAGVYALQVLSVGDWAQSR